MNPTSFAVVPVLVGPLQVLLALLPGLLLALGTALVAMLKPRAIWTGLKLLWRQKMVVAAIAVFLIGLGWGARSILSLGGSEIRQQEEAGRAWPMFRGGPARPGSVAGSPAPVAGGLNWSFLGGGPTYYSTPAVVGNRVYVTSAEKGPFRDRGAIFCLDADTGGLAWTAAPRGFRATFSSPAVSDRFLVCGEGLHFTDDARVVCLDVRRKGEILWTFRTASHVESSPCIHGDRVYIGAGDDGYYCFRLEPDAAGKPVLVWHADGQQYPDAETSPAVCDDRVLVGLGMGGKAVCCLHAKTGDELWRVATPYPVFGPPTVVGERVFVGMGNGNFIQSAELVRQIELDKLRGRGATAEEIAAAERQLGPIGEVWCLNLQTGEVHWKFAAGRTILGAVAAGEERLYFGSRDGYVYCLSLDGQERGRWNAHAPILTSPALAGDLVYVVTETGKLYGLAADDLELLWENTLGFAGPFLSSPTVGRGHVYVGTSRDGLLCLGNPSGEATSPTWPGSLGGPGRGGCVDDQPLPERGKFAWRFPASEDGSEQPAVSVTAPVACLGDRVYVPVHGERRGLVCLQDDPDSGSSPVEFWSAESPLGAWLSPAATGDTVYFVDGRSGDDGRQLRSLDAATGSARWQVPVESQASGELLLWTNGGMVVDRSDGLSSFDEAGNIVWQARVGRVCGVPACAGSIIVVATQNPAALSALDRVTGQNLWQVAVKCDPAAGPVLHKKTVVLGTASGLAAFTLVDGSPAWELKGGAPACPLSLSKGQVMYVRVSEEATGSQLPTGSEARRAVDATTTAELVFVDAVSGKIREIVPGAESAIGPLVSRDGVLFLGETGLVRYSAVTGKTQLWLRTSWMGSVTSPAVMSRSRVYFATQGRGLVCVSRNGGVNRAHRATA